MNTNSNEIAPATKLKKKEKEPWSRDNKIQATIAICGFVLLGFNALLWYDAGENFAVQQRAWVGVQQINLRPGATQALFPGADIALKNTGQTPALSVTVDAQAFPSADPACPIHRSEKTLVTLAGQQVPNGTAVAPDAGVVINTSQKTLDDPGQFVVLCGTVTYQDVFDNDARRVTSFCRYYPRNEQTAVFSHCPNGDSIE